MTNKSPETFGVVGAIIEKDGKFLLVKENRPGLPDHGKWNHPAGKIDSGENPLTAASREVFEETGHNFTPTHILGLYSLARKDLQHEDGWMPHPLKVIFTGTLAQNSAEQLADDVSEIGWFSADEIKSMSHQELRDHDIKIMVERYLKIDRYPLSLLHHHVVE